MGKDRKSEFLPFYWKAKYFHDHEALEYAVKTFPNEQKPLVLSIERDIWYLYYATHHLPEGYIGYVDEDLPIVEEVEKRIARVEDEKTRDELNADFQFYKELILNYHEWRMSGEPNLEEWGRKNGKNVDSRVRAYCYRR